MHDNSKQYLLLSYAKTSVDLFVSDFRGAEATKHQYTLFA